MNDINHCHKDGLSLREKIRFIYNYIKIRQMKYVKTFIVIALLMDFLSLVDAYQLIYSEVNVYFWINLVFCSTLIGRVYGVINKGLIKNGRLKMLLRGAL